MAFESFRRLGLMIQFHTIQPKSQPTRGIALGSSRSRGLFSVAVRACPAVTGYSR